MTFSELQTAGVMEARRATTESGKRTPGMWLDFCIAKLQVVSIAEPMCNELTRQIVLQGVTSLSFAHLVVAAATQFVGSRHHRSSGYKAGAEHSPEPTLGLWLDNLALTLSDAQPEERQTECATWVNVAVKHDFTNRGVANILVAIALNSYSQ